MSEFFNWLMGLVKQFRVFVVVLPWEVVIRCRLGKHVKTWGPGWHFRIPFIDTLNVVNTRLRVCISPTQTLTTRDGQPLSVAFSVGFSIRDAEAALMRFAAPESSVAALVQSKVAAIVSERDLKELHVSALEADVLAALALACDAAMCIEFVRVLDFVSAPTLRLLQEQWRQATDATERTI